MATFIWSDKSMACIATYNILEGDDQLNQFDRLFLKFDKAGGVALAALPYYPKFGAANDDIEGRADQMGRKFFKYLITLYTNRKERKEDSVEKMLETFKSLFQSKTSTIADLAAAADSFLKFKNEF